MSDIVERLRRLERRLELTDRRAAADIAREAAAELTRLRGGLAAALEERDKLAKEVALLREAMSRESDGAQYLASLLVEAEAALLSVSQQRGKAESERNAAQEREQRMREALEKIAEYLPSFDYVGRDEYGIRTDFPGSPYDRGKADASKHLSDIARAALSAIRGEP